MPGTDRAAVLLSHTSVDGVRFGTHPAALLQMLGTPEKRAVNYTGEIELSYGQRIYRCLNERFVEATFPDTGRLSLDGVEIINVFDWLGALPETVDVGRFRISLAHGMAYDYRDPAHGSITVFEAGHWDGVVAQATRA